MPLWIKFGTSREELDLLRSKWAWLLAAGTVFILAGLLALANTVLTTVASVFFVGAMMIVGGLVQIIYAFQVRGWDQFLLWMLIGILYVSAGLLAFADPLLVSAILTFFLALSILIGGILRIAAGVALRPTARWGWLVVAGVIAVIAGVVVLSGWPVNSLWLLGALLAIDLLSYGVTLVVFAFALHRA